MISVKEGGLEFEFPDGISATKFDSWSFYRHQFQKICGGTKAVDIVATDGRSVWLLEIKDYRTSPRRKSLELGDEIARKVRDTLAGLTAAAANALDESERDLARRAICATAKIRIVVHLEQVRHPSRLLQKVEVFADLTQKLRQLLKSVDPHPMVVDIAVSGGCPWIVRSVRR